MRSLLRSFVLTGLAALIVGGCGGSASMGSGDDPEEDRLGSRRYGGSTTRVFIAAQRAFEELGIEIKTDRRYTALSGSIPPSSPGENPILVNLTLTDKGKSTLVECTIYNVRAGKNSKARIQEKVFNKIAERLRKFAITE